ncbi:MAG: HEAT repeat domain-containing protein [Pseudomonadota bacterium]
METSYASPDRLQGIAPESRAPKVPSVDNALNSLNIARLNFLLYPEGHQKIRQSLEIAFPHIRQAMAFGSSLSLTCMNRQLRVNAKKPETAGSAVYEIALSLDRHDIQSVVFTPALTLESLYEFISRLVAKPGETQFSGTMAGIIVKTIQYDRFTIVQQREIQRRRAGTEQVTALHGEEYSLYDPAQNPDPEHFLLSSPVKVTRDLNRKAIGVETVAAAYTTLLHQCCESPDPQSGPRETETTRSDYLKTFLYGLNPTLRAQFLSLTFAHCADHETQDLDRLFEKMDSYLILKMLDQANREKREISPGVINMIRKVVTSFDPKVTQPQDTHDLPSLKGDNLQHLFNREKYEKYVEQDYDTVLKKLALASDKTISTPESIDLNFQMNALDEPHMNQRFFCLVMKLMKLPGDHEDYQQYCRLLVDSSTALLDTGDASATLRSLGLLRHQAVRHPSPETRAAAAAALEPFGKVDWTRRFLGTLTRDKTPVFCNQIRKALLTLGPSNIADIVAWCGYKTDLNNQEAVLNILPGLGQGVVDEADQKCSHQDPLFLKNMILILKTVGSPASIRVLHKLRDHPVLDIRMASMEALVQLGDKTASDTLLALMESDNDLLAFRAMGSVGKLGMTRAVPRLVKLFRMSLSSSSILEKDEAILHALGAIGSSEALPLVKKILTKTWSLFPARLARLQAAACRSLPGYPEANREALVQLGLSSRKDEVRDLCLLIARGPHNSQEQENHGNTS